MTRKDRLYFLQEYHYGEFVKTRKIVEDELSNAQNMFCVCGKLATGFHEMYCKKFKDKVTSETIKRLEHLK